MERNQFRRKKMSEEKNLVGSCRLFHHPWRSVCECDCSNVVTFWMHASERCIVEEFIQKTLLFTWQDSWNIYTLFIQVDYLSLSLLQWHIVSCENFILHVKLQHKRRWCKIKRECGTSSDNDSKKKRSCLSRKTLLFTYFLVRIFKFPFHRSFSQPFTFGLGLLSSLLTLSLAGFFSSLFLFVYSSFILAPATWFSPYTQFGIAFFCFARKIFITSCIAMRCASSQMILQPLAT